MLISAVAVETGIDDDGTKTASPQYGVSVDNSACVALESGIIRGASAGLRDGGGNTQFEVGTTVITRT